MSINKKQLLLLLPFICFIIGYTISTLIIGSKTYATPKLIGLSLYEAIKLTSPHQINIRILSEKESAHIPAGIILNQKPSPGRIIKAHQSIFITTTKSPPDIIAPLLLHKPQASIEKICHDMNLKLKTYEIEHASPSYSCITQLPQANKIIHDKKIIAYCAKEKQNMYLMPDFTGQELTDVMNFLKEYTDRISLFHGTQKIAIYSGQKATVISQKPLAGSLISIKSPLNIQLEINTEVT